MHGINCGNCDGNRGAQAYITAYDIAVKHGYEGSEKEWVESLQSVFVARVTANNQVYWECDTSYEELLARSAIQEVHLLTMEGRTAFLNGASENKLVFQTLPYEDEQIGNVYEMYEWVADGEQRVFWLDAYAPGQGAITKAMLASAVQTSLDKADTAYQKPGTGIPFNDLKDDVKKSVNLAPVIYIVLVDTDTGIAVDLNQTDLRGYINPQAAVADGADVRISHTDTRLTGSPYISHSLSCVLNDALVFAGAEMYLDDGYAFGYGWYVITDVGSVPSVTKYYGNDIMSLFGELEPEIEP